MTTPTPRVLHVAHQVLPHVGGLEAVVAAETRGLAARGWRVSGVGSHRNHPGAGHNRAYHGAGHGSPGQPAGFGGAVRLGGPC